MLAQDYTDIEYIIVDGASTDGTLEILKKYEASISILISEQDKGMYDALNKGIALARGEVIGLLNADDEFAEKDVVTKIHRAFKSSADLEVVIGDVKIYHGNGKPFRYYSASNWHPDRFVWGFMPPHPSFYCKTLNFKKLGGYRLDFEIASDYELLIRFLKIHRLKYKYLPLLMVNMQKGGKSSRGLWSLVKINQEILKGCKLNGLKTNYLMLYLKYFKKIFELGKSNTLPFI